MFGTRRASSLLAFCFSLFMSFTTAGAVDLDPATHQAVPGDFNGDGRLDALMQPLVETGQGGILLQDGTGNLTVVAQGWDPGYLGLDWSVDKSIVTAADLNGDGLDDVVVQPRTVGNNASVLITDPTIQLLNVVQVIPAGYLGLDWSSAGHLIVPGDFDGDHQKELLLQTVSAGAPSAIVHADQTGHLVVITQPIPDGYLGRRWDANDVTLYVGDLNGDGRQDLLMQVKAGSQKAGESAYALLLADENGRFTQISQVWNTDDLGADWSPATHTLSLQDLNGTGVMSIVLTAKDPSGTNYVFQPSAQGTFSKPAAKWTGPSTAHDVMAKQQTGSKGISVVVTPPAVAKAQQLGAADTTNNPAGMTMNLVTGNGLATSTTFGSMGGQSGAEGGSASYSIPIAVPPGIAGMQPSVSLNYSSQGGNGELGFGWSLSGASAIHRCPSTYAQDGLTQGVTYNDSYDRLCLDGQHLIQVTPGVFRTERDSSVRITQLGGDLYSSSTYFEVDYQDGRKSFYGQPNTGSAFVAQWPANAVGPFPTLVWAIAQTYDASGNNIIYNYKSYGNGEYHLTQIQYTGNTSGGTAIPGNREVDFTYAQRSDLSSTYLAGGRTDQTQVLTQITTKIGGAEVLQYSLNYSPSGATGRSLLRSVQECGYAAGSTTLSCLPADTFSWQEPSLSYSAPQAVTVPVGMNPESGGNSDTASPLSHIDSSGDYDGDGQNELYYADTSAYAFSVDHTTQIDLTTVFGGPQQLGVADDLMRNGLANPIGQTSAGDVLIATCNSQPCESASNYSYRDVGISSGGLIGVTTGEFTGNGLADIVLDDINRHGVYLYTNLTKAGDAIPSFDTTGKSLASLALLSNCLSPTYQQFSQIGDMDGDGIPDLLITGTDCAFPGSPAAIAFIQSFPQSNGTVLTTSNVVNLGDLGINLNNEGGIYSDISQLPYYSFSDINGDGLKDFVYVAYADGQGRSGALTWHYQINQGGDFGFAPEVDTGVVAGYAGASASFLTPFGSIKVGDFTAEGKDEFLVPIAQVNTYCEIDKVTSEGVVQTTLNCSQNGAGVGNDDYATYTFKVLKFVEQSNGIYVPIWVTNGSGQAVTLNFEPKTGSVGDLYGTGVTGVFFLSSKWFQNALFNDPSVCNGISPNPPCAAAEPEGYYSITPTGGAPDLMTGAVNGLGAQAAWQYDSLADLKKSGAYVVDERPCSGAPNTGVLNTPTAKSEYYCFGSSMWVVKNYSVSNGVTGSNSYTYQYSDAVYEDEGRGFQGFQTIAVNDIAGDTQTKNTYYQKFPLSGMLSESKVIQISTGTVLSDTTESWQSASPTACLASAQVFWPQLQGSEVKKNNTDGTQISDTTTTYGYDGYGNTTSVSASTIDPTGTYSTSTTDTFGAPDCTDWWTDAPTQKTVSSTVNYSSMPVPAAAASITRTANYTYNTALRKVKLEQDDLGSTFEKDTAYTFDVFSNIATVKVSSPDAVPTGTLDPAQDYGFAARTTATAYTVDSVSAGYFVQTITDQMGHVTTISSTDLATGQPLTVTATDGVVTNYTYDAFGRKATKKVGDMNPVNYTYGAAYGECTVSSVYSYYTTQLGNITKITCNDILGRVRQTITAGFIAGNDTYQETTYDTLGRPKHVYEPYTQSDLSSGATLYYTQYKTYDVLNRVKDKIDAKGIEATYTYGVGVNPLEIQIVVTPPDSPAYTTYETHNSSGKLLSTIDANSSETDFRYDAGGNPTLIQDAAGNQTVATFNILGQKTAVTDPDMGSWAYAYDVLGELLQQTDAKSQQITMTYDLLGRMTSKSSSVAREGVTTWTYDSYANCSNGVGKLCNVTQYDGYSETDSYDQDGRLASTDENIKTVDYITSTAYDADGRVSTVTYPATIADTAPVITSLTANNASSATVLVNDPPVTLAVATTDADLTATTPTQYEWSLVSTTCNCTPALSATTGQATQFTPAVPGIYTFKLTASDGLLATSSTVTVTVQPQAPGAASINTNTGVVGNFGVNWSAASGASAYNPSYNLYQSTDGVHFTLVACPSCAQLTQSFTGMGSQTSNITYTYEVTASANGVEGPADALASTTVYYPPSEPTPHTLPAQSTGNRTFTVSWTASTGVSPSYTARAGIPGGDAPTIYDKGSCNTSGTSCVITVAADNVYVVKVSSCNQSACNGGVVAPGEVNVWHFTPPAAPTGLGLAFGTGNNVTVSWTAPSAQPGAIMTYELFYQWSTKTGPLTAWTQIYSGSAASFATTIPLTRYDNRYYVVACNQAGCGASSSVLIYTNDQTGGGGGCGGGVGCQPQVIIGSPVSGTVAAPSSSSLKSTATPVNQVPAGGPTAMTMDRDTDKLLTIKSIAQIAAPKMAATKRMTSTLTFDYAPPVYKAYADAHLEAATSTSTLVGVTVLYHYDNIGYLTRIENAANPNQVFWKATGVNARDQVTDEQYGVNGTAATITSHRDYYPESGYVENIQSTNGSAVSLQNLHYDWQELGNLADRQDLRQNVSETFGYDILNRVTSAQVTNGNGTQPSMGYTYDALGNIMTKSDVSASAYVYGGVTNAGPHAVTSIPGVGSYSYDPNGNMTNRNGTTVGWNSDNLPTSIVQDANNTSAFNYAPDKHRVYQSAMVNGLPETTVYAGGLEIVTDSSGNLTHNRYQLSAYGRTVAIVDLETASNAPVINDQFVLSDHLGSMDVATDATGAVVGGTGWNFEAFGKRRDASSWQAPINNTQTMADRSNGMSNGMVTGVTHRGHTGHEMLDNVGLVHANGRVYDPLLGRFLSVDPVFQFPTNTQSLNPYSYVLNNPLSATDPSGYTENCTAGQTTGCPPAGQSSSSSSQQTTTTHVSYTPTGSHIAISGNVTSTTQANGNLAATADNKPLSDALSAGAKSFAGGNGEQNSQQGAGSIIATGKSQAGGTAPSTATQAASVNNATTGDTQQGHLLNDQQLQQFNNMTYSGTQGNDSGVETVYTTDEDGKVLIKTQEGCEEAKCALTNPPPGSDVGGHTHVYPEGLRGLRVGQVPDMSQRAAMMARDMPGPGDTAFAGGPGELITPSNAHYSFEGTPDNTIMRYRGGGDAGWGNYVQQNWHQGMNDNDNYNLAMQYLQGPH